MAYSVFFEAKTSLSKDLTAKHLANCFAAGQGNAPNVVSKRGGSQGRFLLTTFRFLNHAAMDAGKPFDLPYVSPRTVPVDILLT